MQLATQKGPIACQIPGFSNLRTVRPLDEQRSVADLTPHPGMLFKSSTGSVHAVVSTNDAFGFVNTVRVATDNSVRFGRILYSQSIQPSAGVAVYRLPAIEANEAFGKALADVDAIKVLSVLFEKKGALITHDPTLGRERLYTAYLENFNNSLEHLELNKLRGDGTAPAVGLTTHYGGITSGTIAFDWPLGGRESIRPEAIRGITADANIRMFPDYLRKLEAVVHAAGVFNAIIQAQHALPSF